MSPQEAAARTQLRQPLLTSDSADDDTDFVQPFLTAHEFPADAEAAKCSFSPDAAPTRGWKSRSQELMQKARRVFNEREVFFRAISADFTSPTGYETHFPPLTFRPGRLWISFVLLCGVLLACGLTVWKTWLAQCGFSSADLLKYVSIPIVSVMFTYAHIWAALYLTFFPLQYRGWCQIPGTNMGLGWQGIVPNKAEAMARKSVELMTMKLINVKDVFARIDPDMLAKELDPVLQNTLTDIIREVAMQEEPELWMAMPESVKTELILKAREGAPPVIKAMCQDVKERIEDVFDLSEMVVNILTKDKGLLNHMFIKCGYDELKFIRDTGGFIGLGFGIFQVSLWIRWSAGWMLPAFGLVAGLFSNWFALKMIFQPVDPILLYDGRWGRWELQGLFLKRQKEVSVEYGRIVAANVLSSRNMIPAVIHGRCSDRLFELVHRHVIVACDDYTGLARPAIALFAGQAKYDHCKSLVAKRLMENMGETMSHVESQMDDAMDLENLIREKLRALPSRDFEDLLHPVFQEDEWKLVLMGGVLGVVVGMAQWWALGS